MSRRYPTAELYDERQRDFYGGSRSGRNYDDLDSELSRPPSDYRRSQPDFLRNDYGRSSAGQLVVRGGRGGDDFDTRSMPRSSRGDADRTDFSFRDRRSSGAPGDREYEREDISFRRDEHSDRYRARPRESESDDIDIRIRRSETEDRPKSRNVDDYAMRRPSEPRSRETERTEIDIRREERSRSRPRRAASRGRGEIRFRHGEGERHRSVDDREEIIYRHEERDERASRGRESEFERDTLVIRDRERSLPAPRLVAREQEDFVIRRRETSPVPPPPQPQQREERQQIIIRRTEREPSPSPERSPSPPPPPPEPIVRPPIIQEVITHHRHIDHGVERARSPTPPPPPPSPPREETLEIEIKRKSSGKFYDEDIIFESETSNRREKEKDVEVRRRRSMSAPRKAYKDDVSFEVDYSSSKTTDRKIDSARNSEVKFSGPRRARTDMWTEVTKDLVLKESIERMGYDYEETDRFFYVMEYLKYEDVVRLVEHSDQCRRDRRSRIRDIEFERERKDYRRPNNYDDNIYEREIIYDSKSRRY